MIFTKINDIDKDKTNNVIPNSIEINTMVGYVLVTSDFFK